MVGRHHTACHTVHQHRNAKSLSQFQQLDFGVSPPHVGPGHDHRALRRGEQLDCARQRLPVCGVGARQGVQRAGRRPSSSGRGSECNVHREVDERHARRRADGGSQRVVDHRRHRIRRGRGARVARQGCDERHVVDLLQRAHPPAHRGSAPAEDQHRRLVLLRRGHRTHAVGDARAGGQCRDTGDPGHLRPALGRECRGLLVAGVDQTDALGAAAVVDREQVPTRQRENGVDTAGPQPSRHELARVDGTSGSFVAHGPKRSQLGTCIIVACQIPGCRRLDCRRRPHRPDDRD